MSVNIAIPRTLVACAHEAITVQTAAVGLTATTYGDTATAFADRKVARAALLTLEGGTIRYSVHGADPTSTTMHQLFVGDTLWLDSQHAIQKFRAIKDSTASADGTLRVTYFY